MTTPCLSSRSCLTWSSGVGRMPSSSRTAGRWQTAGALLHLTMCPDASGLEEMREQYYEWARWLIWEASD